MLTHLSISNVVLIEKLDIDFQSSLCALTGETGAGKSILLDSMGLALGDRADTGLVRKGAEKSTVIATFELDKKHPALAILAEADFEPEVTMVLRRILTKDGRSKAFVNDQPASVGLLKKLGETLVEIHGQFDTHGLMNTATHKPMLDEYAGLLGQTSNLKNAWQKWQSSDQELTDAEERAEALRAEEEYLRHVVDELIKLAPEEGEEENLAKLKLRLQNREQVLEGLNQAQSHVTGEGSADAMIQKAYRALGRIEDKVGEAAQEMLEALDRASAELGEAMNHIESYASDMNDQEYHLQDVDDRLYAIRSAARKHECRADDLQQKCEEFQAQLETVEAQDDILSDLAIKVDKAKKQYIELAQSIHQARAKFATKLDAEIMAELPPLKLEKARFVTSVKIKPEEEWSENGMDKVEFLIATNPQSDPSPLSKVASGGEMARFMLALKVVLAEIGAANTLVFDEADTGIGGAVAEAVGERLARLGVSKQVLVVTHSPQVAAQAKHHWHISKADIENSGEVRTSIRPLAEGQERREEIARMLAGAEITQEARAAADRLLNAKAEAA